MSLPRDILRLQPVVVRRIDRLLPNPSRDVIERLNQSSRCRAAHARLHLVRVEAQRQM